MIYPSIRAGMACCERTPAALPVNGSKLKLGWLESLAVASKPVRRERQKVSVRAEEAMGTLSKSLVRSEVGWARERGRERGMRAHAG